MEESSAELLRKVKQGDLEAYNFLVREHMASVRCLVASHFPERHMVNEITQEVFIFAYDNITKFSAGSFGAWLSAIAKNMVRREKQRLRRKGENELKFRNHLALKYELPPEHSLAADLDECLARLGSDHKALLMMKYRDGMESPEIAQRCQRSRAWVRTTLHRVREVLRQCLDEDGL